MTEVVVVELKFPAARGQLLWLETCRARTRSGEEVYLDPQVGEIIRVRKPISWIQLWICEVRVQATDYEHWMGRVR